jgi:hypothetical protein
MAPRRVRIVTTPDADEPVLAPVGQAEQVDIGRFRLQVDRQIKSSYLTYEAAEQAGLLIKRAHPILQVAVYDAIDGVNKILELPKS